MSYDDEFPKAQGPYAVPSETLRQNFDRTEPTFIVELDWGAFRRVWEIVEAEGSRHFPTRETLSTARAELRAVEAFRETWRESPAAQVVEATSTDKKAPRRFKRSNDVPEAPAKRKLQRRPVAAE